MKRVLREAISKDGEKLTEISGPIQKPAEQQDSKEVQKIIKKWSNPPKKPMPEIPNGTVCLGLTGDMGFSLF